MTQTIRNSWELVKSSGRVLMADRELLVFPLLSSVATILVTATFFVPAFLVGGWEGWATNIGAPTMLGALAFYIVQYTVVFFFNSALVGAALIRLEGGDPTVGDGLRIAGGRFGVILGYALIAATVGVILNTLSRKLGILGKLIIGFTGVAWNLATYLAVPVLVSRDMGPVEVVKESATLFRRTWGEQVVGVMGMGAAFGLGAVSLGLFSVGLIMASGILFPFMIPMVLAFLVLAWILYGLGVAALKGIYTAALYRYAVTGEAGWGFEGTSLGGAFAPEGTRI